jgi:SAM-dependent methyltransferase
MGDGRMRHRQGTVRIVDGIPYSDRRTTLSLLTGATVGRWLAANAGQVHGTLLDLGAGNQPFRPWYRDKATRVVAIDAAPAPGLDVLSLASTLPFLNDTFDTILCTSVLEHVENAEATVAEIARVLRPGGQLLMTVPFLYPTHESPYDFWRTTHHGLRSVLHRHGLQVDDMSAQGGPFMLMAHYAILAVVGTLRLAAANLGRFGWIVDNRIVNAVIAAPQELLRTRVSIRLTGLSRAASLGYMVAARKP